MLQPIFSTEIWLNATSIVGILYAIYLTTLSNKRLLCGKPTGIFPVVIVIFVTLYIGTRPLWCYADTSLYTTIFNLVQSGIWDNVYSSSDESFWLLVEHLCIKHTDASNWLLSISCFYVIGMSYAAYRWMPRHFLTAILFMFTAFSFWGYATNGIRHGMATSLALAGLSFFMCGKRKLILGYSLLILSALTHKSCHLIIATATAALFFTNTRINIKIWLICIVLGALFQNQFKSLFTGLVGDNRMADYILNMTVSNSVFSKTGFRWDFILYSSMPIILGWYAIIKKGISDKTYIFLLNTYIFANTFWVLINTTAYSNRFAYLSWFMYPILLAYPMVKFTIFRRQGIIAGVILAASVAFTYIML